MNRLTALITSVLVAVATLLSVACSHAIDAPAKAGAAQFAEKSGGPETDRVLRFRGDQNYPPFEYLNGQKQPEGFNVDILRAVAKAMGLKVTIDLGSWDEVKLQLEQGKIDALMGMYDTKARGNKVDFSVPHLIVSYAVFVRRDSALQSIADAKNKKIIVQSGDLGHDYVKENDITPHIIMKKDWADVLKSLSDGEGDCAIVSRLQGIQFLANRSIINVKAIGSPIIQRNYCFAVTKGNTALQAKLNEGLNIIKISGEYDAIYKKWFGGLDGSRFDLKTVLQFGSVAILIFLGIITWNVMLKRQVKAKTDNLVAEIEQRKQAEEALASSEQFLSNVIEQSPVSMWIADSEGTLIRMNQACRELFGITDEEAVGKYNILKDNLIEAQGFMALVAGVFEKGEIARFTIHYDVRRVEHIEVKGATHRILDVVVSPIKDIHGKLTNALVEHKDVTESKRVEEALQKSEKRLREAQEMAHLGFWNWDVKTGEVEWSEEVFKIFCLDPKAFTPQIDSILALSPWPEDHQRDQELINRAIETHSPGSYEQKFLRPDKSIGHYYSTFQGNYDEKGDLISIVGTVLDITERKQAEEALRESGEKFSKAFQTSPYAITITRPEDGRFIEVNDAFTLIAGYTREEALTDSSVGLKLWANEKERESVVAKLRAGGAVEGREYQFRTKSGKNITGLFSAQIIKLSSGPCILSSINDITARKRVEEALREANENLEQRVLERTAELTRSKHLLDETGRLARVGGWELDLKKNVLSFSEVTKQIHEVDPEYQPTLEVAINFYAPEAVPMISEAVRRAIEEGEPYDVELQLITAKQNRIWVRTVGQAYRDNGKIVKIGGVFQDINERKLVEIEVRKKSEQLQLLSNELEIIIDSIPGLVFYKDTNNRFIRVNKYMSDVYKMSKKQLEGVNLNDLHSKEQAQAYYEDDLQVIRSRQSKINIDEPWETETGFRWVSTSKIPYMDEKGEVVGVIGVSLDVTERKLAEQERGALMQQVEHRSTLLEASNKELEAFTYSVSHDLRAPLRHINGYVELLINRFRNALPQKGIHYLDTIADSTRQMAVLIDDLLQFSRTGRQEMRQAVIDMNLVLQEVL
jgi:PAS domain S-box-containing protein